MKKVFKSPFWKELCGSGIEICSLKKVSSTKGFTDALNGHEMTAAAPGASSPEWLGRELVKSGTPDFQLSLHFLQLLEGFAFARNWRASTMA